MQRVSFNVNASRLRDRAYFLDYMHRYQPTSVTVMNAGHNFLADLLAATEGKTIIVRREYSEAEGNQWKHQRPYDYVEELVKDLDPRVWTYVLNEPGPHGDDLSNMLDWIINVGELLEAKGYHASLGNLGAAVWTEEEVISGRFDKYLTRLADWSERDIHYGGWHEYTGILLPAGVGQWPLENLTYPDRVQIPDWPLELPLEKTPVFDDAGEIIGWKMPPYWHILRTAWFDLRAIDIGVARHKKLITEFFLDRMPDWTQRADNVYDILERMYGLPDNVKGEKYSTMRGPLTMQNVYAGYYPGVHFEKVLFEQFKYAEQIYDETYIGLHTFTWSYHEPTWDLKNGFDCSSLYSLHRMMIEHIDEQPEEPKPKPSTKWYWEFLKVVVGWLIDRLEELDAWLEQK